MKIWQKILALCLISVSAYWWGQRGQREEIDQLRSSMRSVSQSLQDTNRAVAQTAGARFRVPAATEARTAEPAVAAPAAAAEHEASPTAAADPEPAKQPSIDPATLRAHLSSKFDRQASDAAWSGAASLTVQRKLAALMPASALKAVECKETMCRIEMVYDDLAQYQAFLRQVTPQALPWNGTFFSTAVGDTAQKPVTFVAFLSREGQELAVD